MSNILLTPARIGPVAIGNRVVMPPMATRTADEDSFVTDDTVAYYMARVRGGVGLITVEMAAPEKCGRHRRREVKIYRARGELVPTVVVGKAARLVVLPGAARHRRPHHAAGADKTTQTATILPSQ